MRQNNGEGGCKQRERQFDWRSHDPSPQAVDLTHFNSSRPALAATEGHQGLGHSATGKPIVHKQTNAILYVFILFTHCFVTQFSNSLFTFSSTSIFLFLV